MSSMLSNEAQAFLQYCWKDDEPRIIQPMIGDKFFIDGKNIKFTEKIYEEMLQCDKVKVDRFGDKVNIRGL